MSCCFVECKLFFPNEEYVDYDQDTLLKIQSTTKEKKCTCKFYPFGNRLRRLWNWLCFMWFHKKARKCRKLTFLLLIMLCLLVFTILFIMIPLIFMNSISMQRNIIFSPRTDVHEEFNKVIKLYTDYNVEKFYKPMNFYVNISESPNTFIGSWYLLPHELTFGSKNISDANFFDDKYPVVLFLHGFHDDRRYFESHYNMLMQKFYVITFDYRGYGDSSAIELTEASLVEDGVEMYKWLHSKTNGSTYIWGDALGSTIAVEVVAKLHDEGIQPTGLILEQPSESLTTTIQQYWSFAKILTWLPWYKVTILNPLEHNGFYFNMTKYISKVDCPVMIWEWGYTSTKRKIDEMFRTLRDPKKQGFVTYVQKPSYFIWPHESHNIQLGYEIELFITHSRPIRKQSTV